MYKNKLINDFPTILQSWNSYNTNSWFNGFIRKKKKKKKLKKKNIEIDYIKTLKIKLDLNYNQTRIINKWLDDCIDVYNLTNTYIKSRLTNDNKKILNFYDIRKKLLVPVKRICSKNNLNKHTADYQIKHCIEMYKSAISNKKDINKFNITNMNKDKIRKNLVIEPSSVSKKYNSIFYRQLGIINGSLKLNIIKSNSILQYNKHEKSYIIITPVKYKDKINKKSYEKCGIDIGVRTFVTTFNTEESFEIGTNTNEYIDRINKRLDKINKSKDEEVINENQYNKLNYKYRKKIKNKIDDLHNKTASFLLNRYDIINIGKVSTKSMISNIKGNLREIVKRRLTTLSHYRFRMKLLMMSKRTNTKVNLVSEYLTSKKCSNCKNIHNNLGSNKLYDCSKCKIKIDRDVNASINIYNI